MNYDSWKTRSDREDEEHHAKQQPARIHWKASDPCPPIPIRDYDYVAWYEGEEDLEHYGWGKTPEAAQADLREQYDPERDVQND